MAVERLVTLDPNFLEGEPVFIGTHISVRLIVTLIECGEIDEDLLNAYRHLTPEMLAYARTLSESLRVKQYRRAFADLLR